MDCKDCANYISENKCYSMIGDLHRRPKNKWCFMTRQEALDAENAIVEYIDKYNAGCIGIIPQDERTAISFARKKALIRIKQLKNK